MHAIEHDVYLQWYDATTISNSYPQKLILYESMIYTKVKLEC